MRARLAISSIWPLAVLWAVLIGAGFAFDANWPQEWFPDFLLLAFIASFLVLLATLILRRMHGVDFLTIALASVFLAMSVIYFFGMGTILWPHWFAANRDWLLNLLRIAVAASGVWATALLLLTPDGANE